MHDAPHPPDVDAPRRHVRGHEDRGGIRTEPLQAPQSLPLLLLGVDGVGGEAQDGEERHHAPHGRHRVTKDHRPARVQSEEVVEQRVAVAIEALDVRLVDPRGQATGGRHVDDVWHGTATPDALHQGLDLQTR